MKTFPKFALAIFLFFASIYVGNAQCPPASSQFIHVVQKGESLYRISKKYYMTVDEIAALNRINTKDPISICQELIISNAYFSENGSALQTTSTSTSNNGSNAGNAGTTVRPQGSEEHIVRSGETIAGIAYAYGYTEERFRRFNGLDANDRARVGVALKTSDCVCPSFKDDWDNPEVTDNGRGDWDIPATETRRYDPSRSSSNRRNSSFEEDPFGEETTTFFNSETGRINPSSNRQNDWRNETTSTSSGRNRTSSSNRNNREFLPADEKLAESRNNQNTNGSGASSASMNTNAARYMTAEEIEMVKEINLVRSNPAGYIQYIEAYKNRIAEGRAFGSVETANELISELRRTPKLTILQPTECIYAAAKKHGQDQRPTGDVDHVGTDGSYPWDRVKRECPNMLDGGENLVAGPSSVRDCVILLLIDDGIPNRGHRRTMLKADWKYAACYKVGQVGNMPNNWIQKYGR